MMYSIKIIFVILFVSILYLQCELPPNCGPSDYYFKLNEAISYEPVKDSYKLGDTITVKIKFSNKVYEISRKQYVEMNDMPFSPYHWITIVDKENNIIPIQNKNDIIIDNIYRPDISNSGRKTELLYYLKFDNQHYYAEFKLVLKTSGVYFISTQDFHEVLLLATSYGRSRDIPEYEAKATHPFEGKCSGRRDFLFFYYFFKGEDNLKKNYEQLAHIDTSFFKTRTDLNLPPNPFRTTYSFLNGEANYRWGEKKLWEIDGWFSFKVE